MGQDLEHLEKLGEDVSSKPDFHKIASKEIHFFDEHGKKCDKEHAVKFVANSFDKDGKRIQEVWGTCKQESTIDEYLKAKK